MSVRFEVADHVATVTIDRPDVLNAIDLATEAELVRIWDDIERSNDIRVVVLTGAGERSFRPAIPRKGDAGEIRCLTKSTSPPPISRLKRSLSSADEPSLSAIGFLRLSAR